MVKKQEFQYNLENILNKNSIYTMNKLSKINATYNKSVLKKYQLKFYDFKFWQYITYTYIDSYDYENTYTYISKFKGILPVFTNKHCELECFGNIKLWFPEVNEWVMIKKDDEYFEVVKITSITKDLLFNTGKQLLYIDDLLKGDLIHPLI